MHVPVNDLRKRKREGKEGDPTGITCGGSMFRDMHRAVERLCQDPLNRRRLRQGELPRCRDGEDYDKLQEKHVTSLYRETLGVSAVGAERLPQTQGMPTLRTWMQGQMTVATIYEDEEDSLTPPPEGDDRDREYSGVLSDTEGEAESISDKAAQGERDAIDRERQRERLAQRQAETESQRVSREQSELLLASDSEDNGAQKGEAWDESKYTLRYLLTRPSPNVTELEMNRTLEYRLVCLAASLSIKILAEATGGTISPRAYALSALMLHRLYTTATLASVPPAIGAGAAAAIAIKRFRRSVHPEMYDKISSMVLSLESSLHINGGSITTSVVSMSKADVNKAVRSTVAMMVGFGDKRDLDRAFSTLSKGSIKGCCDRLSGVRVDDAATLSQIADALLPLIMAVTPLGCIPSLNMKLVPLVVVAVAKETASTIRRDMWSTLQDTPIQPNIVYDLVRNAPQSFHDSMARKDLLPSLYRTGAYGVTPALQLDPLLSQMVYTVYNALVIASDTQGDTGERASELMESLDIWADADTSMSTDTGTPEAQQVTTLLSSVLTSVNAFNLDIEVSTRHPVLEAQRPTVTAPSSPGTTFSGPQNRENQEKQTVVSELPAKTRRSISPDTTHSDRDRKLTLSPSSKRRPVPDPASMRQREREGQRRQVPEVRVSGRERERERKGGERDDRGHSLDRDSVPHREYPGERRGYRGEERYGDQYRRRAYSPSPEREREIERDRERDTRRRDLFPERREREREAALRDREREREMDRERERAKKRAGTGLFANLGAKSAEAPRDREAASSMERERERERPAMDWPSVPPGRNPFSGKPDPRYGQEPESQREKERREQRERELEEAMARREGRVLSPKLEPDGGTGTQGTQGPVTGDNLLDGVSDDDEIEWCE
ncbi:hypothetical protein KIPB_002225 [Kipferlia bialata]|uniref:Uncharacterized protein n=1 Tax=Kipferlia bialata TaxID=797122 RepID=A0A9K3CTE9_9EUKA|nr:hypothetical protein KIPB_002225 [Kipferlia bialata]|eukprot:g2225.t1